MDRERATQALMKAREAQLILGSALFLESKRADAGEVREAWEEAKSCLAEALALLSEPSAPTAAVPFVQEQTPS